MANTNTDPATGPGCASDVKPSLSSLNSLSTTTGMTTSAEADVKPNQKLLDQLTLKKYSGVSFPGTSKVKGSLSASQEAYAWKLRKLKKTIKDYIFVNGAVCDEVLRTEEKLARVKEERRFLLRKLLQFQSLNESMGMTAKADTPAAMVRNLKAAVALSEGTAGNEVAATAAPTGKGSKGVKRKLAASASLAGGNGGNQLAGGAGINVVTSLPTLSSGTSATASEKKKKQPQSAKDILDSLQGRPKKSKSAGKKTIPPLMLDSLGRPMIPMMLGDITLHSMGEIVTDRLNFHCPEAIFPAGYCITRVYISLHKADSKCLYTCKISEGDSEPLFEIAPEDSSDIVFRASNPSECHSLLLRAVNKSRGAEIIPTETHGLDFFGLSHSVIQNLIQSIPGARKCSRYKWVKFEIDKTESNENFAIGQNDPTISYEAFLKRLAALTQARPGLASQIEKSTNLRSLLTKSNGSFSLS